MEVMRITILCFMYLTVLKKNYPTGFSSFDIEDYSVNYIRNPKT